jgi:hypothetical protein
VGLTLRLLQLFYLSRRPLKFDRLSMSAHYRHFSQVSLPFFRVCSPSKLSSTYYQTAPEGAAVIYVHTQLQLLYYIFLSYMTRAWGMPTSFVHSFIFSPTPWERFGSYRFPSPSNGSLLTLPTMLFLTQVLSVEETLMYFGYTYAPNLITSGGICYH